MVSQERLRISSRHTVQQLGDNPQACNTVNGTSSFVVKSLTLETQVSGIYFHNTGKPHWKVSSSYHHPSCVMGQGYVMTVHIVFAATMAWLLVVLCTLQLYHLAKHLTFWAGQQKFWQDEASGCSRVQYFMISKLPVLRFAQDNSLSYSPPFLLSRKVEWRILSNKIRNHKIIINAIGVELQR